MIPAGGSADFVIEVTEVSGEHWAGNITIEAKVDPSNKITENLEDNDTARATIYITEIN